MGKHKIFTTTFSTEPGRRSALIKTASLIAIAGNFVLAVLKIGAGLYSGSMAVVGDGIDTSVDIAIALMSLVVARIIARPADKEHPWGHGRAETVATALLSFILFFVGAQLSYNSVSRLVSGGEIEMPETMAIVVTLISIGGKIFLAWTQYLFGKKAGSAMLKANARNMSSDVIISAGVLVGLVLSRLLGYGHIDSIAAMLVGLWVIKSAIGIFMEANMELMDGNAHPEVYNALFEAVKSIEETGNPHRVRMRHVAGLWDIDMDIEVNPNCTVMEAHGIAYRVEQAIKKRIEGVYDIMIHVEPAGNQEDEGYGLHEET